MKQAYGYNAWFGWGEEDIWGNPVPRAHFGEFAEDGLKAIREKIFSESFRGRTKRHYIRAKEGAGGLLRCELHFEGYEKLLKHLFGAVSTTKPDEGNAPNTYRHIFSLSDEPPAGLSLEVHRDAASFLYPGSRIAQGTFSAEIDKFLKLGLEIIAKDEIIAEPAQANFSAPNPIDFSVAVCKIDGELKEFQNFELTINHNLSSDRRCLGSRNILAPLPSDKREIKGALQMFFESISEYNAFLNSQEKALEVCFEGAPIESDFRWTLKLEIPRVLFTGETPQVDAPGALSVKLPFEALCNADDSDAVILTLINKTENV